MSDLVLTSFADGIAVVTINRPEARNAVNRAVADAVAEAIDELDARDDLVVGVITGPAARSAPVPTSRPSPPVSAPASPGAASAGSRRPRPPSR